LLIALSTEQRQTLETVWELGGLNVGSLTPRPKCVIVFLDVWEVDFVRREKLRLRVLKKWKRMGMENRKRNVETQHFLKTQLC